jgi:hypothetical protein
MLSIYRKFCNGPSAAATFLTIYIEEAHAVDRWFLPQAPSGVCIKHHTSDAERRAAAQRFIDDHSFPAETLVDTMADEANTRYDAWPERLYIIVDGVVVYKGGAGPFGYRLDEVAAWLAAHTATNN